MKRKKKIFVDNSFWISILDPEHSSYEKNREKYKKYVNEGCLIYTSNIVLGNAFSYFYQNISSEIAEQFYHFILRAYNLGSLRLEWVGKKYSKETIQLFLKGKKEVNFDMIEASIYAICKAKRITYILSDRYSTSNNMFSWLISL